MYLHSIISDKNKSEITYNINNIYSIMKTLLVNIGGIYDTYTSILIEGEYTRLYKGLRYESIESIYILSTIELLDLSDVITILMIQEDIYK